MKPILSPALYLFNSRMLTHIVFWVFYYVFFSFLWAKEGRLFASFELEFVLMPLRIGASYVSIYYLIPQFLGRERLLRFLLTYLLLVIVAGLLQRVLTYYFHELLLLEQTSLWSATAAVRSIVLINSTVMLLSALKIYQYWIGERKATVDIKETPLEIRSDKRYHRVRPSAILYVEGLGNYITIYLENNKSLISYLTLKEAENLLPDYFQRIHKSFIINKDKIASYNNENVEIGGRIIPIGKSYEL